MGFSGDSETPSLLNRLFTLLVPPCQTDWRSSQPAAGIALAEQFERPITSDLRHGGSPSEIEDGKAVVVPLPALLKDEDWSLERNGNQGGWRKACEPSGHDFCVFVEDQAGRKFARTGLMHTEPGKEEG